MTTIDIRELEEHPAEIMQRVKSGEAMQLTQHGRPIATLTPVTRVYSEEEGRAFLAQLDEMASELAKYLPEHVDAVETVREIRREL